MTIRPEVMHHFQQKDPALCPILAGIEVDTWMKPVAPADYFKQLCRDIVYQQLAGKAAATIFGRFQSLFPGGDVKPESLLALSDQDLRDKGLSWAKAKYVRDLAAKVMDGGVHLEKLPALSDEDVIVELVKVKGIGRWTAEMFLMFSLGREDIFSFGDLGLRRGIEKVYGLDNPAAAVVENIVTPWSPYKTYGSIALWESLETKAS